MKILFLGDIVGRAAREAVIDELPALRRDMDIDFVVVNGENAAGGFGITETIANSLFGRSKPLKSSRNGSEYD